MAGYDVTTVSLELVRRTYKIADYSFEGAVQSVEDHAAKLTVERETILVLKPPVVESVRRTGVIKMAREAGKELEEDLQ